MSTKLVLSSDKTRGYIPHGRDFYCYDLDLPPANTGTPRGRVDCIADAERFLAGADDVPWGWRRVS